MLQVLQTPAGATLVPTMMEREQLVQDRSRADLGQVLQQTENLRDSNRRTNETHPLTLEGLRLGNEEKGLGNASKRFDNQVRDTLGTDFYVQEKKDAALDNDFTRFERGVKQFRDLAGMASSMPPGMRQKAAAMLLQRSGMPDLAAQVGQIPDEQIPEFLNGAVKRMNENALKYVTTDMTTTTSRQNTIDNNKTRLSLGELKAVTQSNIARMMAEAKRYAADKRAISVNGSKPMNLSQYMTYLGQRMEQAAGRGDQEEVEFLNNHGKQIMEMYRAKPESAPTDKITDIQVLPDGTVRTRESKVPAGQEKNEPANGWGTPRVVK